MNYSGLINEKLYSGELKYMTSLSKASKKSLSRVFQNMEDLPYIIVSSDRHECTKEENIKRFKRLKEIVKEKGFSYIPVKGGYLETNENGEQVQVFENSLIIFWKDSRTNIDNYSVEELSDIQDALFEFGLYLIQYDEELQDENGNFISDDKVNVETFGQDLFLFKGDKGTFGEPAYYNKEGEKEFGFSGKLDINNQLSQYFTQLVGGGLDRKKFSFTEVYIPSEPRSYSERHIRHLNGELL